MTNYDEQVEREHAASRRARADSLRRLSDAIHSGNIDQIPAANIMIGRMFPIIQEGIEKAQAMRTSGAGAALRGWLREVPAPVLAAISLDTVMRKCITDADGASFQTIAKSLGRQVVLEACVHRAAKANPAYFARTTEYLKAAGTQSRHHIERTMRRATQILAGEDAVPELLQREYISLGKHLLQPALDAGLCYTQRRNARKGTLVSFHLADDILEFVRSQGSLRAFGAVPELMIAPPLPWGGEEAGGYYTPEMQRSGPIVRHRDRTHIKARDTRAGMLASETLIGAVNYLQSQAFTLDPRVCDLARKLWQEGGCAMGLPAVYDPPKPAFPHPDTWKKAEATPAEMSAFDNWKVLMRQWHTSNRKRRSEVLRTLKLLDCMQEFGERPVYAPVFVDWRGRLYYRGAPSPQGTDLEKAAMRFAEKKPLGERGVFWLKVHIANCFGQDKARFKERARWTEDNWKALCAGLQAPQDSPLYNEEADSPFCAYAAVQELLEAYNSENPSTFLSGLVVHMDATCSGLQHFSAMLRDPTGAEFTNLRDSGADAKSDIYAHVAGCITNRLVAQAADGCALSQRWLAVGVDRAFAKKPCMTYVYGATRQGMAEDAIAYLLEKGYEETGTEFNTTKMAHHIVTLTFQALEDTVPAAAACMNWLKARTRALGKQEVLTWTSPIGAKLHQEYDKEYVKRVWVQSCGLGLVAVREPTKDMNRVQMANGISPNFVHSLDAAHLVKTVEDMQRKGLQIVTIHDSYGTHAADVDSMHESIRETFVGMYSEHDPLQAILDGIGDTETSLPTRGTFDLEQVKSSEFFFC